MADSGAGLDCSFESKEDYELYMRLMSERQRIQKQAEQRKKQRKSVKVRQAQEERERGFQLYVSGANEERVDEARRKRQLAVPATPTGSREWQVETVELRGNDGSLYRSSPHHRPDDTRSNSRRSPGGDLLTEESPEVAAEGSEVEEREGSRPGTGASVSSLDQDTRGVLHMMNTANRDQLLLLRESLTSHIDRKLPGSSPKPRLASSRNNSRQVLEMHGGKSGAASTEQSRPTSSASSAIASAIQAENARAKRLSEGGEDVQEVTSRNSSRPQSKAGQRLPLSPEVAAECAPPSVLASGGLARRSASNGAAAAYTNQSPLPCAPGVSSHPSAPSASGPRASSSGAYPNPSGGSSSPVLSGGSLLQVSSPAGSPALGTRGVLAEPRFSDEIVDRVGRLDRKKQKALLRVLETLETSKGPGTSPQRQPSAEARASPTPTSAARRVVDTSGSSICIRVLSNWGNSKQCGLSHIEALDAQGEVLRIPPAALSLHGTQGGCTALPRVLEGKANTTNEKLMWVATPCARPAGGFEPFDIALNWPPNLASPAALRFWNFNGPEALSKGVREVVVLKGGREVWAGQLPQGTGRHDVQPAVATLELGFQAAGYPVAAAAAGPQPAPLPAAVAALVEAEGSASQERPAWFDSLAVRADLDSPVAATEASAPDAPEHVPEPEQEELMLSLQALEMFRSSQSRKFFSELRAQRDGSSEDLGALGDAGAQPFAKAGPQPPLGVERTAQFGASPTTSGPLSSELQQELVPGQDLIPGQDVAFGGLNIPVRAFDDQDVLDGLVGDERGGDVLMGSSLVAGSVSLNQSVVIPTLPRGRTLVFNCVSTWGDQSFVGLAGIEIFDGHGFPVVMKDAKRQVSADPPSINVLPEYEHDPRTADKLFDQVNLTRDDLHVWLAPFSPGMVHTVTVDLERKTGLSMIRIWNYNKSRLHSSRGVRDMEILLDGVPIFVGEIRRAPGVLTTPEEACEHILFTQDESVLRAVEEHDWLPAHLPVEPEEESRYDFTLGGGGLAESLGRAAAITGRPPTADFAAGPPPMEGVPAAREKSSNSVGSDGRPITRASTERHNARGLACSSVTIVVHSTWGDLFYVGLTALELLDSSLTPIPLDFHQIDAAPRDLNDLEGVQEDPRTLDKLIDGVCCTCDDLHMWMVPFIKAAAPGQGLPGQQAADSPPTGNVLRVDFGTEKREVAGFNIWNYNKNVEDTSRGVREFSVYCDERYIATFLCRKAPGHVHFDFKQVVLLDQPPSADANLRRMGVPSVAPRIPSRSRAADRSLSREGRRGSGDRHRSKERGMEAAPRLTQQYETPLHPCGFIFKLLLLSTWSDLHYIGLRGVELYDLNGRPLRPKRAVSNYGSVRNLPGMENDVRTENCFLQGAPGASGHMWLAPFCRLPPNAVELVFDEPTHISCVHVWNYARTPSRGVRDIEIYVDDLLIYQGILRQETGAAPALGEGRSGEAVLFTTNPQVVERERSSVYLPSADELVAFFDESGQVEHQGRPKAPLGPGAERPMTAVTSSLL